VMIIALSHNHEIEPIGNVIRQIRAQCAAEIILTTEPIGQDSCILAGYAGRNGITLEKATEIRKAFLEAVEKLAAAEHVEFIPLRRLWNEYLDVATRTHEVSWFMRDETHANVRGRQVVARMLEAYFAPK